MNGETATGGAPAMSGSPAMSGAPSTGASPSRRPLILAAHGTRAPRGRAALSQVHAALQRRLPQVEVRLAYVDVQEPDVTTALAALGDAVIVPYLLTAGFHVEVDLAEAVATVGAGEVTAPLLPGEGAEAALAERLAEVGGTAPGTHVILVGAGSTRPGVHDVMAATGERLAARLGLPVTVGALTGAASVAGQVAALRAGLPPGGSVACAAALLLPGQFHDRLQGCGADVVAAPLADHPRIIDVLVARYLSVASGAPVG